MGYMARQPILDEQEQTYGYELLYRAAAESFARISDTHIAAQTVLDDLLVFGCEEISGGRQLFLNCSYELLSGKGVSLLPRPVVIEVLETIEPDNALLHSLKELKEAGFLIALDDFTPSERTLPMLELADIIKIDFRAMPMQRCAELVKTYCGKSIALAEKVETQEEYQAARDMGCSLFQGYFFARPALMETLEMPPLQATHHRLLAATCKETMDFVEIEQIIKSDVALCYKLLRYLNAVAFCQGSKITSLRQALVLLGETVVRRWIAVSSVTEVCRGRTLELMSTALLRARFCELLSPSSGCKPYDLFMTGLFSMMDVILRLPLSKILTQVEFSSAAKSALLGESNRVKKHLELALSYCDGDWSGFQAHCLALQRSPVHAASAYLEAVRWVNNVVAITGQPNEC